VFRRPKHWTSNLERIEGLGCRLRTARRLRQCWAAFWCSRYAHFLDFGFFCVASAMTRWTLRGTRLLRGDGSSLVACYFSYHCSASRFLPGNRDSLTFDEDGWPSATRRYCLGSLATPSLGRLGQLSRINGTCSSAIFGYGNSPKYGKAHHAIQAKSAAWKARLRAKLGLRRAETASIPSTIQKTTLMIATPRT
jgi:hypothetical protein